MSVKVHDALKPQAKSVLMHLTQGGSLTDREADRLFGIRRLAARIREIREVYGDESVSTEYEGTGRKRWARYRWSHGSQLEIGL